MVLVFKRREILSLVFEEKGNLQKQTPDLRVGKEKERCWGVCFRGGGLGKRNGLEKVFKVLCRFFLLLLLFSFEKEKCQILKQKKTKKMDYSEKTKRNYDNKECNNRNKS